MDLRSFIRLVLQAGSVSPSLLNQKVTGLPNSREILLALCEKDQFIRLVKGCACKAEVSLLTSELDDQLFRYNRNKDYLREPGRRFLKQLEVELLGDLSVEAISDSSESQESTTEVESDESARLESSLSLKVDSENSVIAVLCGCKFPAWLSSSNCSDDEIETMLIELGLTRIERQVTYYRHGLMGKKKEDFAAISKILYDLDAAPMVQKIYSEALVKISRYSS